MPGAYPRSRGATTRKRLQQITAKGLSPLARGNPNLSLPRRRRVGPIPARAGQPLCALRPCSCATAYPRSRGATRRRCNDDQCVLGLSPLARGNQAAPLYVANAPGPIPARAGQPAGAACPGRASGAYPRSRGATLFLGRGRLEKRGLSPLARGNLDDVAIRGLVLGPIPARAGQPLPPLRWFPWTGAYPRSRGATFP